MGFQVGNTKTVATITQTKKDTKYKQRDIATHRLDSRASVTFKLTLRTRPRCKWYRSNIQGEGATVDSEE